MTCSERITEYLAVGGLFNPEMLEHDKVRNLLMDCRNEINLYKLEIECLKRVIDNLRDYIPCHD